MLHIHAARHSILAQPPQQHPAAMDKRIQKKPARYRPSHRKGYVEVPRQARLDLAFHVVLQGMLVRSTFLQAVAAASNLRPKEVEKGLAAFRDTLIDNLAAKGYGFIPEMLRFRKVVQTPFQTASRMVDGQLRFERKARSVRKTLVKCTVLKPLRVAVQ